MDTASKPLRKTDKKAARHSSAALIVFTALVVLFVAIAKQVREGATQVIDERILLGINRWNQEELNPWVVGATELAGLYGIPVLVAGLVSLLWLRGRRDATIILLFGVGGAAFINSVLKLIFERTRPELWDRLVVEHSFSFPSGHAMASAALAACLVAITWDSRWRYGVLITSVIYVLIIGFSRMYLGVHYPSDILAGWSISVAWVMLVRYLYYRTNPSHAS